jgi:hypothetical protein
VTLDDEGDDDRPMLKMDHVLTNQLPDKDRRRSV